jgi:hypothetical protein
MEKYAENQEHSFWIENDEAISKGRANQAAFAQDGLQNHHQRDQSMIKVIWSYKFAVQGQASGIRHHGLSEICRLTRDGACDRKQIIVAPASNTCNSVPLFE